MDFVAVDLEDLFLLELVKDDTPVPSELDELLLCLCSPYFLTEALHTYYSVHLLLS